MTNAIAELRDLNLELESLKARKNAIKTKLAEHRDSFTDEDITNSTTEANEDEEKEKAEAEAKKQEEEKQAEEDAEKEKKLKELEDLLDD